MEKELNTLLPELLSAVGFTIKRVPAYDFLVQARAQGKGCTTIERVSVSITELRPNWDVMDLAIMLTMRLAGRVLGNEIIFFDNTDIVKYNVTTASCQLLLPHGTRIERNDF